MFQSSASRRYNAAGSNFYITQTRMLCKSLPRGESTQKCLIFISLNKNPVQDNRKLDNHSITMRVSHGTARCPTPEKRCSRASMRHYRIPGLPDRRGQIKLHNYEQYKLFLKKVKNLHDK